MSDARKAVILLEDDEDIAHLFAQLIGAYEADPVVCDTLDAVLSAIRQRDVALALLDIMLPGVDGREVASTLRKEQPDLPLYFMTGVRERDIGATYREMADGVLQKPFSIKKLRTILEEALMTRATPPAKGGTQRKALELLTTLATDQETIRRQQAELRTLMQCLESLSHPEAKNLAVRFRELALGLESCLERLHSRVEEIAAILDRPEREETS